MFDLFRRRVALAICPELAVPPSTSASPERRFDGPMADYYMAQVRNADVVRRLAWIYVAATGFDMKVWVREWPGEIDMWLRNSIKRLVAHPTTGCKITTKDNAVRYFASIWPADLSWPTDVPRPSATKRASA